MKATRFITVIVAAIGIGLVSTLVGRLSIYIPVFSGASPFGDLPLATTLPLILIILIGSCISAGTPPVLTPSARNPHIMNVCLVVLATGSSGLTALAVSSVVQAEPNWFIVRNVMGFASLQFIGVIVIGYRLAALVPVLYVFAAALFGRTEMGGPVVWAWPLSAAGALDALVFAVVACTLAACTALRRSMPSQGRLRI